MSSAGRPTIRLRTPKKGTWEYRVVQIKVNTPMFNGPKIELEELQTMLDTMAADDWELVNTVTTTNISAYIDGFIFFFKRRRLEG